MGKLHVDEKCAAWRLVCSWLRKATVTSAIEAKPFICASTLESGFVEDVSSRHLREE